MLQYGCPTDLATLFVDCVNKADIVNKNGYASIRCVERLQLARGCHASEQDGCMHVQARLVFEGDSREMRCGERNATLSPLM